MILVHGFAPIPPLPSPSPFCVKLETWLRMASFAYELRPDGLLTVPKARRVSVTLEDGTGVEDTDLAVSILAQRPAVTLDRWLTPKHRAASTLVQRTVENHLYYALLHSRWVEPDGYRAFRDAYYGPRLPPMRWILPVLARRRARRMVWMETGRKYPSEIWTSADQDFDALVDVLGDKAFFCGDRPSTVDASVYGIVGSIHQAPGRGPLQALLEKRPTLVKYVERVRERYWP
jgi:hypothetical protein